MGGRVEGEVNQGLIPLGFQAVAALLQDELRPFAGRRYARGEGLPGHVRWSHERGSIYLADQNLGMVYPRVRNRQTNMEDKRPCQTKAGPRQPRFRVDLYPPRRDAVTLWKGLLGPEWGIAVN